MILKADVRRPKVENGIPDLVGRVCYPRPKPVQSPLTRGSRGPDTRGTRGPGNAHASFPRGAFWPGSPGFTDGGYVNLDSVRFPLDAVDSGATSEANLGDRRPHGG